MITLEPQEITLRRAHKKPEVVIRNVQGERTNPLILPPYSLLLPASENRQTTIRFALEEVQKGKIVPLRIESHKPCLSIRAGKNKNEVTAILENPKILSGEDIGEFAQILDALISENVVVIVDLGTAYRFLSGPKYRLIDDATSLASGNLWDFLIKEIQVFRVEAVNNEGMRDGKPPLDSIELFKFRSDLKEQFKGKTINLPERLSRHLYVRFDPNNKI